MKNGGSWGVEYGVWRCQEGKSEEKTSRREDEDRREAGREIKRLLEDGYPLKY